MKLEDFCKDQRIASQLDAVCPRIQPAYLHSNAPQSSVISQRANPALLTVTVQDGNWMAGSVLGYPEFSMYIARGRLAAQAASQGVPGGPA
eukprot:150342-Rhodomonas_salina.1